MLKRIFAAIILIVFLVNTMGYFVVFKCNQMMAKEMMMNQIRSGLYQQNLIVLQVVHPETNRNYRHLDKGEFSYYGNLYDLVFERKNGDTTLLYCFHDKKEENLIADFSLFLKQSGKSASPLKNNPVPALLHNLISQALIQEYKPFSKNLGIQIYYPEYHPITRDGYIQHLQPPPERF